MSIEAMKQAIEALERSVATCFDQYAHQQAMSRPDHFINQAITSLRQAIAEAEKQEPVGEILLTNGDYKEVSWKNGKLPPVGAKLYTHPEWVGLTDEEVEDCYKQGGIGRAIQMLKEKNSQ